MKKKTAKTTKLYAIQRKKRLLELMTVNNVLKLDAIQKYCNALISGTVKKKIQLVFDETSKSVYTTGTKIVINPQFPLVDYYENIYGKLMCIIGLLAHELAHVKYLNFELRSTVYDELEKQWYWAGKMPTDEVTANKLVERCNASIIFRNLMIQMFHNYNNIFDDVHDEACLFKEFDGSILAQALSFPRCAMENNRNYLDEDIRNGMHTLSVCSNLLLYYARYRNFYVHEETKNDADVKVYLQFLEDCKKYIEQACITNDMQERFGLVNEIIVTVFRFFEELMQKPDNQSPDSSASSESSDDSEDKSNNNPNQSNDSTAGSTSTGTTKSKSIEELSDKEIQDVLNEMEDVMNKISPQKAPELNSEDTSDAPELTEEDIKKNMETSSDDSKLELEDKLKDKIGTFIQNEIQRQYECEEETKRTVRMNQEAKTIEYDNIHARTSVQIIRASEVTEFMKFRYQQIYKEVQVYSKAMQRQILAVLKDRRAGGKMYGQIYGNRFESQSIARLDGCYFSKTKMPIESPTIAMGVLIDESGSMQWNNRIGYARKAAIMLEDFARGLDIPTMIYGHTETSTVVLRSYSEFDKIDRNDKYRLVDTEARQNNRDGYALKYMVEALKKRPEEVKILFIISDGQPAAYRYSGASAIQDIQNVVAYAKKNGVLIFAAAIGDDKETIAQIYGDGFCNISDMERMPKVFANLIKKQLKL